MVLTICLALALFYLYPRNLNHIYRENYMVDSICLVVSVLLILNLYAQDKIDIFSPFSFFSVIYILMYFITPIYDIITKEILWFGVDLYKYGVSGSLYALLGYFIFYITYSHKFVLRRTNYKFVEEYENKEISSETSSNLIIFIVIGYFVCLFANIFFMVYSGGNSILYILTLGVIRSTSTINTLVDIGAISMLSYALPSFSLLYAEFGKNRFLKIVAFLLMFELQVARGFRFFILQIIVMFGAYFYVKKGKKPKITQILILFLISIVPLVIMTLFRTSIRSGNGMDLTTITWEMILDALNAAFWDNLRIYKNYYGLIKVVPTAVPYLYGKQMIIYTAIMLIPRAIWNGKPGNPGIEAQRIAFGNSAVVGGSAYPGLGEYYYELGLIGIIFWMAIMGIWFRKIENKYRYCASSKIDKMIYCTILGSILQIIIRGYTPSNFWMIVFAVIPYWIIKKFL